HYGSICQYRTDQFGFSLEILLIMDNSNKFVQTTVDEYDDDEQNSALLSRIIQFKRESVVYLLASGLMMLTGLVSNTFSIITLIQPSIQRSTIIWFIILTSITSQLTLTFLFTQVLYVILNQYSIIHNSLINVIMCKSSSYLLETCSYISKWSIGVLSINRTETTKSMKISTARSKKNIKFTSEDKQKLILYGVIIILVSASTVTDISFHRIISDRQNNNQDICIMEYSSSVWKTFDTIVLFIHQLVPFMFNVYATGIILLMAARKDTWKHT
ncbi:unnamed protein product, partial [Didymodactylos carnosus]